MPLGMEVGLGPGRIVSHGDPAPPPKRGIPPIFGRVYCGQTVAHLSYYSALVYSVLLCSHGSTVGHPRHFSALVSSCDREL